MSAPSPVAGLKAVFSPKMPSSPGSMEILNCSLKATPADSHTIRLMRRAADIMSTEGVEVEMIHFLDHTIAFGMQKDMTEHGAEIDEWPAIQAKIEAADVLVLGSPIWLGTKSSVATLTRTDVRQQQ